MLQPEEDEEFVVIKAGPPLPLRRPRPLKACSNPNSPRLSQSTNYHQNATYISENVNEKAFTPQAIYSSVSLISKIPSKVPLKSTTALSNISKTEPLHSPLQVSTNTPRSTSSRSLTPTFLNSSSIKSRPSTPVESKVKQYIQQVKRFDEEQRSKSRLGKKEKFLSLEDLYQVSAPTEARHDQMEERLRETLRIIKEKDEMIDKLRESCHELKLKYADAENRIDDMRFGLAPVGPSNDRRSSFTNFSSSNSFYSFANHKRSTSEINLNPSRATNTEDFLNTFQLMRKLVDKSTETDKLSFVEKKEKVETTSQITTDELYDLDLDLEFVESRESNFDPVLEEKCSNWLEKIQTWKTDPFHNSSLEIKDKDSCGDRDSGFRGSAELDLVTQTPKNSSNPSQAVISSNEKSFKEARTSKSRRQPISQQEQPEEQEKCRHKSPERRPSIPMIAAHFLQKQQQNLKEFEYLSTSLTTTVTTDIEQSGPPSLQIAPPWCTFTGNVNPNSATQYEGFPSFSSSQQRDFYPGLDLNNRRSMSMDKLHNPAHYDRGQVNHSELFKSIDKRFQALHPLIDNATCMALRIKRKSDNLSKVLQANKVKGIPNPNVHPTGVRDDFMSQKTRKRQSFS